MLISPSQIHSTLTSLLGPSPASGPETTSATPAENSGQGVHTALLITPQGQVVGCAHLVPDEDPDDGPAGKDEEEDGDEGGDEVEDEDADDEEGDEGPYLEPQERRRLLLGLASQWNEGEGSKMECELGRLHFTYLALPSPTAPSQAGRDHLPPIKPVNVGGFILVLNGGKDVPWSSFGSKAEQFRQKWRG